jgi:NADP-dependent 3-hydroxy acid dehydrogenase YdfG
MKTIIVTGAGSGVGQAVARLFAGKGHTVVAVSRNRDRLEATASEYGGNLEPWPLDVSVAAEVKRVFAEIQAKHEPIDVLVNNAGISLVAPLESGDLSVIDRVIDANLKGTMYCTYCVLPGMIERGDGRIINISSCAGIPGERVAPRSSNVSIAAYGASKYGVVGFGEMARNLSLNGVLMTTLCPGGINTPFWTKDGRKGYSGDQNELTDPVEIAELIEFIVQQPKKTLFKQLVFFPTVEWH